MQHKLFNIKMQIDFSWLLMKEAGVLPFLLVAAAQTGKTINKQPFGA